MKKFIVETYYTCTFKTVHTLDELNDAELSKIDNRKDGEVEVIEVKLNNRKTKKLGDKSNTDEKKNKRSDEATELIANKVVNAKDTNINSVNLNNKIMIRKTRIKMIRWSNSNTNNKYKNLNPFQDLDHKCFSKKFKQLTIWLKLRKFITRKWPAVT